MTEHETIERKTVTDDGVKRTETIEKDYTPGAKDHGDEEAGGAVAGGVAGAAVGAVVGGPVGAVVGGAIGAASGATAGLADEETKDDEVVVTREVRR
jgi:phage tail tape-measure protein